MSENPNIGSNKSKGDVLERVVALMYDAPDLLVESKKRLSTKTRSGKKREIDILITGRIAGHPMKLAIECKNYADPTGVEKIDEFKGKLEAVGMAPQQGIVVSVAGFTGDALDHAGSLGMRTLVFKGLTADRLQEEVFQAFQSIVYLLPLVTNVSVTTSKDAMVYEEVWWLYDKSGKLQGSVYDLIWDAWRRERIATALGTYPLELEIPQDWYWLSDGEVVPSAASATIDVLGIIVTSPGTAHRFALVDANTEILEKGTVTVRFENPEGSLPVVVVRTEDELESYVSSQGVAHIAFERERLPRILLLNRFYWPPSRRSVDFIAGQVFERAMVGDLDLDTDVLEGLNYLDVEGSDISRVWEPIWDKHPAAGDSRWPRRRSRRRVASTAEPRRKVYRTGRKLR